MKKNPVFLTFSALLLIISGCSTPPRNVMPGATPPAVAESAVSTARSRQFRDLTANLKTRGIGIFPEAFAGRYSPAEVTEKIKALGFNRAYCCITTEAALDENMTQLLRELGKQNIPAEIVVFQRDFYRKIHTNQLLRQLVIQYPDLKDAVKKIIKYNNDLPEDVTKLSGITVVAGAHDFTNANVERSHGQLYAWAENRYGIGKDNDMLMRQLFTLLNEISGLPGLPPLTIGVPDFYHEKAAKGELSCGRISDFQKIGKVMLISSGNVATQMVSRGENELKDAGNTPLLITVSLAGHTALKEGRLRRRNWNDFCRTLDYGLKKFHRYPSFSGMVFSPLAVIEFLRQER